MTLVCITNDIDDIRSCTERGEHAGNCDGIEWLYNREAECSYPTMNECHGCLPSPAQHGLLCFSCWEKTRDALSIAADMITHLRSVERAQQIDSNGVRAAANWVIPVPMTWRMADELIMLAGHPAPGFPSDACVFEIDAITERYLDLIDADAWVSHTDGAEAAVRFYRTMQHAMTQHPMQEYEHRIRNVRCTECLQRTLLWKPPLFFESGIRIVCTNKACEFEVDDTDYTTMAAKELVEVTSAIREKRSAELTAARVIRAGLKRAATAARRAAAKQAKAEASALERAGAA